MNRRVRTESALMAVSILLCVAVRLTVAQERGPATAPAPQQTASQSNSSNSPAGGTRLCADYSP
jgi:hypothetical protein